MGICCTGKLSKSEYRNDDIRVHYRNSQNNILKAEPKLTTDTEKTNLNTLINSLITEYLQINLKFKLSKINLDQLYNITLQYKNDFTSCEYIISDLRVPSSANEPSLQKENFLKKFKHINYTIDQILLLTQAKREAFRKYVHNKIIIFILNEASLEQCQKYISFFESENYAIEKIIILDSSLITSEDNANGNNNKTNARSEMELLLNYIDDWRLVDHLPMILLSLKYFPHLNLNNYIFIQRFCKKDYTNTAIMKFTPEFLSNSKEKDNHCSNNTIYNQFLNDFNIGIIFKLNKGVFTSIQTKEFKRKSKHSTTNSLSCLLIEMNINSFNASEISQNKSSIMNILTKFKNAIVESEQCLLIQVDNEIAIPVLYRFVYLFINKITDIPCNKINEYLTMNKCVLFSGLNEYYKHNSSELEQVINTCKD